MKIKNTFQFGFHPIDLYNIYKKNNSVKKCMGLQKVNRYIKLQSFTKCQTI